MKKVVVFGGSGFLGSYVVDELICRGYDVTIADMKDPTNLNENRSFFKCNILEIGSFLSILDNVDIVYNFAAYADIDKASLNPLTTISLNVMGNLNILEACKLKKVKHFVYASSAYALSDKGSFYGISKYSSEKLTHEYKNKYDLNYTIIRYGSIYGERAGEDNFIFRLLTSAVKNKKITVNGTGEELREYIHAEDAARLSVDIIEDNQYVNEHIILTGTEQLKRLELLTMINEILGNDIAIEFKNSNHKGHYKITPYVYHHPDRAKKLIANPFIDMGQGLVECIRQINFDLESKN